MLHAAELLEKLEFINDRLLLASLLEFIFMAYSY